MKRILTIAALLTVLSASPALAEHNAQHVQEQRAAACGALPQPEQDQCYAEGAAAEFAAESSAAATEGVPDSCDDFATPTIAAQEGPQFGIDCGASVAAQYQYDEPVASPSAAATMTELPETGGASILALGGGVLLVVAGLLARRIVR